MIRNLWPMFITFCYVFFFNIIKVNNFLFCGIATFSFFFCYILNPYLFHMHIFLVYLLYSFILVSTQNNFVNFFCKYITFFTSKSLLRFNISFFFFINSLIPFFIINSLVFIKSFFTIIYINFIFF